jgi:hypothetical protein
MADQSLVVWVSDKFVYNDLQSDVGQVNKPGALVKTGKE